jgi:hypothetical protein
MKMKLLMSVLCLFLIGCVSKVSLIQSNLSDTWETINGGEWSVKGGVLFGEKDAKNTKHCILISKEKFKDFKLTVEYLAMKGNSGFYFRLQPENNPIGFKGYHAEIDSKGTNAGGIFDVGVKWMSQPDKALVQKAFKPGDWNTMIIEALGEQINITLNGHKMTSLKSKRSEKGKLGVQLHANENTQIKFKKIEIIEL